MPPSHNRGINTLKSPSESIIIMSIPFLLRKLVTFFRLGSMNPLKILGEMFGPIHARSSHQKIQSMRDFTFSTISFMTYVIKSAYVFIAYFSTWQFDGDEPIKLLRKTL
jgi:hypothetical protein